MPPKKAPACANPLFLQWLEELRDQAREKGLKTADVYNKGCRSLAACPVAYERPRDLAQLAGIGPKTIAVLEARLRAHCTETGESYPESPTKRARRPATSTTRTAGDELDDIVGTGSEADDPPPPPKKKRKPTNTKAYIPQLGSGPYGILLGLLLSISDARVTIQAFLTKGELIRAAQPYCNSSYDHSERGTFVTAWNGMKTLINKGYVVVQGSPHRYCLTEDGYDIAVTIRNLHPEFADQPKLLSLEKHVDTAAAPVASSSRSKSPAAAPHSSGIKFEFWYIASSGARVMNISEAQLRLCPDEFVTMRRIEFRAIQKTHPIVSLLRQIEEGAPGSLFGYIVEDSAPPRCSSFDGELVASSSRIQPVASSSRAPQPVASSSRTTFTDIPQSAPVRPAPRLSSALPLPGEQRTAPAFDPADAITFPHGTYDVVLILDTREVESRNNRDKIAEALAAKNVAVETRALRLGDMCWVARRRDGHGGEEDECVLDYVVERKRLDDLCSSIRDGRYKEQCFRLSQSGIGNVFYIVEDWQVAARMETSGKQIMTAKSQIQVINGFFLKETHKLAETIDFLATMTKVITTSLRDLHVIPARYLSRTTYTSLQAELRRTHPRTPFLTSFDAYQALNDKSASRTIGETLARMLLCIRGMSPERVAALLERWDTPRALYDAMAQRASQGVRTEGKRKRRPELFFADEVKGDGRDKIGDALSRDLWRCLWGNDEE